MYCAEQQRGRVPQAAATRSTARKCFTTAPAERGENQVGRESEHQQQAIEDAVEAAWPET
jgi:hypothetical protein